MTADVAAWTSLLPPLAAIVLAVWTRHVVLSLFVGLLLGVTMLSGDRLLGTAPARDAVPTSPTARTLGEGHAS